MFDKYHLTHSFPDDLFQKLSQGKELSLTHPLINQVDISDLVKPSKLKIE